MCKPLQVWQLLSESISSGHVRERARAIITIVYVKIADSGWIARTLTFEVLGHAVQVDDAVNDVAGDDYAECAACGDA